MPPEEDQAMAINKMHKNLVKIGHVVREIWSWTDAETGMLMVHSPVGVGVTT